MIKIYLTSIKIDKTYDIIIESYILVLLYNNNIHYLRIINNFKWLKNKWIKMKMVIFFNMYKKHEEINFFNSLGYKNINSISN